LVALVRVVPQSAVVQLVVTLPLLLLLLPLVLEPPVVLVVAVLVPEPLLELVVTPLVVASSTS
jgi:hypothetical protein